MMTRYYSIPVELPIKTVVFANFTEEKQDITIQTGYSNRITIDPGHTYFCFCHPYITESRAYTPLKLEFAHSQYRMIKGDILNYTNELQIVIASNRQGTYSCDTFNPPRSNVTLCCLGPQEANPHMSAELTACACAGAGSFRNFRSIGLL